MKTVQDYRNLGLVFVNGDFTIESDGSSNRGDSGFDVDRYFNQDSAFNTSKVESFAWRNNDGVKPEYRGVIEVALRNGSTCCKYDSDAYLWPKAFSSVFKWRPVVLQSDDAKKKIQEKFLSALRSDSQASKNAELRGGFKLLREHLENEPPFWNKSMPSFNCPCVAVNIEINKPTASPKEDKTMKPVYTAEMHEKNELPPVDSKVTVCIEEAGFELEGNDPKHEGKVVTVKAAFVNKDGEKLVAIENDKGNCACYIIECIKPIIKTIKVNGFDVPAPMSEAPEHRQMVYLAHAAHVDFNLDFTWQGDDASVSWLSRGLVHSTKSAAIAHSKAMLGIDPNA